MNINETGGSAFPIDLSNKGMTLRDYFAAKAMQSLISIDWIETEADTCPTARKLISGDAYAMADAMMEARK